MAMTNGLATTLPNAGLFSCESMAISDSLSTWIEMLSVGKTRHEILPPAIRGPGAALDTDRNAMSACFQADGSRGAGSDGEAAGLASDEDKFDNVQGVVRDRRSRLEFRGRAKNTEAGRRQVNR